MSDVLAFKRPEKPAEDFSVEWYGTQRMLARLSPDERVEVFLFGCSEAEARLIVRVAARQIGPSILTAIAAGLEECNGTAARS